MATFTQIDSTARRVTRTLGLFAFLEKFLQNRNLHIAVSNERVFQTFGVRFFSDAKTNDKFNTTALALYAQLQNPGTWANAKTNFGLEIQHLNLARNKAAATGKKQGAKPKIIKPWTGILNPLFSERNNREHTQHICKKIAEEQHPNLDIKVSFYKSNSLNPLQVFDAWYTDTITKTPTSAEEAEEIVKQFYNEKLRHDKEFFDKFFKNPKDKNVVKAVNKPKAKIQTGDRNSAGIQYTNPLSGIGDNGRSSNTPRHETLSAYMAAAMLYGSSSKRLEQMTKTYLSKFTNKVPEGKSLDEIYKYLWIDWFKSSYLHGKTLKKKGYLKSNQFFYLDGKQGTAGEINRRAAAQMRDSKIKLDTNKWNTADIWIIRRGVRVADYFGSNLIETRQLMLDGIKKRDFIGVSLKQTKNPILQKNNFDKTTKYDYKVKKIKIKVNNKVLGNKAVEVSLDRNAIFWFRAANIKKGTFGSESKTGGLANAGSVNMEYIFSLTQKYFRADFAKYKKIADDIKNHDNNAIDELIKKLKFLDVTYSKEQFFKEATEYARDAKKRENYIRKAMLISAVFDLKKQGVLDKVINLAMMVGAANRDWSSPFIKIY